MRLYSKLANDAFLSEASRYDHKNSFSTHLYNGFFTPYTSKSDFLAELISPITLPVINALATVMYANIACSQLAYGLLTLLVRGNTSGFMWPMRNVLGHGCHSGICALMTVVSPLVSVISFLTRLAATLFESIAKLMRHEGVQANGGQPVDCPKHVTPSVAAASASASGEVIGASTGSAFAPG